MIHFMVSAVSLLVGVPPGGPILAYSGIAARSCTAEKYISWFQRYRFWLAYRRESQFLLIAVKPEGVVPLKNTFHGLSGIAFGWRTAGRGNSCS